MLSRAIWALVGAQSQHRKVSKPAMAVAAAYCAKNLASRTDSGSMIRVLGYRTDRAEIGQGWFLALEASMVSSTK